MGEYWTQRKINDKNKVQAFELQPGDMVNGKSVILVVNSIGGGMEGYQLEGERFKKANSQDDVPGDVELVGERWWLERGNKPPKG